MKINRLARLLSFSAAVVFLAGGCTTPMRSFNQDYDENYPPQPNYSIKDLDADRFKLRIHQGTPYQGAQRVVYMKQAAWVIANAEGQRRHWVRWKVDYIQERDQGWMHVLVAIVTREK